MATVNSTYISITCDEADCHNTVTFPQTPEGEKEAFAANPWMNSLRFINTLDERKFVYCSDECAIKATATGIHNKKVIIAPQTQNSVDLAAQAAERARQATEALKSGHGKVVLS